MVTHRNINSNPAYWPRDEEWLWEDGVINANSLQYVFIENLASPVSHQYRDDRLQFGFPQQRTGPDGIERVKSWSSESEESDNEAKEDKAER